MSSVSTNCTHISLKQNVSPGTNGCQECMKTGDEWLLLRMCLICGHVGCCDTSKGKHATKHFQETGHPIVRMLEQPDETDWCYIDKVYIR